MMQSGLFEKTGNTWWIKCQCGTWFPASQEIVRHPTVKMRCPQCGSEFDAKTAAAVVDPVSGKA